MTEKPISASLIARIAQATQYVISGVTPQTWFGPMQPLDPIAPPDVAGRRFDYPTGYNLTYTPRVNEAISFEDLRALADNCDILRSVIETRKDQMEALNWQVRVKPTNFNAKMPTPEQQSRIAYITEFMHSPDKEHNFSGWLRQILEDMFVIDAACIYKRNTEGGELYALEVIDGATIKILIDDAGRSPMPPDPAFQQVLKGVPACDYTRDELMYLKHNPRSHRIYGYSHVEQVMVTVNILIRRALHQLEYYREGSQPDAFIGLPKEWNQDQIVAFQKHFDSMLAGNLGLRRRLRFMPGEFKYQETKPPPLKDAYDEFLARIICYVFSVSPEPFVSHATRATAETSQDRANDEGLAPLQAYVCELMNRIIRVDFSSPDLEFVWQDTREQDPKEAASIDVAYVTAGIMTVDEVRSTLGLPPMAKATPISEPVKKKIEHDLNKAGFNPDQPRDELGMWTSQGGSSDDSKDSDDESDAKDKGTVASVTNVEPTGATVIEMVPAIVGAGALAIALHNAKPSSISINDTSNDNSVSPAGNGNASGASTGNTNTSSGTGTPIPDPDDEGEQKQESLQENNFTTNEKIEDQLSERGWTQRSISDTINNPYQTGEALNRATGNPATAYFAKDGSYVVIDNVTKEVVQVSDRFDKDWILDPSIKGIK